MTPILKIRIPRSLLVDLVDAGDSIELLVRDEEVDIRSTRTAEAWTPASLAGLTVEVVL